MPADLLGLQFRGQGLCLVMIEQYACQFAVVFLDPECQILSSGCRQMRDDDFGTELS
ncbi:MAG: hypothetical protein ABSH41_16870 [Syntrophobacteraceae bacterium]|jgi:hypothetical protein